MSNHIVTPRPAATLIVVRDAVHGLEVLLAKRTHLANFAGGAYVFPGGAVDAADSAAELTALASGIDDEMASKRLGIEQGGLGYWIAAIRECYEEAGLLFAHAGDGELIDLDERTPLATARQALAAGKTSLPDLLHSHDLCLATDRLHYFGHWITQAGRPRRYTTRFFLAEAPAGQTPLHDGEELVSHLWIAPAEAIERNRSGDINLMFPTLKTLESLARLRDVAAALEFARTPRPMPPMNPRVGTGGAGKKLLLPGDFAYAELGKLDPQQKGTASYEIIPGNVVQLSDRVRRITAPNPSVMTGPGTNTYVIGDASTGVAVIDPGPLDEAHVARIVEAAPGPIRWILCTHTHVDHSPGAALLKERTRATTYGMVAKHQERQDQTFVPDSILVDGERIEVAGVTLRVLHTPGHASNQLCFLLEDEKMLFTGDHIMQGSTVVINPPDGNMSDYFASLERLYREDIEWLAPGHGFLMERPHEVVERLILHRQNRENKVVNALRNAGQSSVEGLVPSVYDDTPERMHRLAARSLLAHLHKLEVEGRARCDDGVWQLID
ncbi:MAG: MBL fold metallo-hydrolase [Burkholderiales bacterium]|jgi:glyoxylase-like metal-dependent hydrolase (beta-lactamase superfamily II)/8-oxo-dGTP pyrophosphatase MutT (NUDIX family)